MKRSRNADRVDLGRARETLESEWSFVVAELERHAGTTFLDDETIREAIGLSIHHQQVAYRYCLPVQVLGKLVSPSIDALCLQRGKDNENPRSWDARSLASKVVAPFVAQQENVLGTSGDPYVGNAFRIPRMLRNDVSKKDTAGWNRLIDVLEAIEGAAAPGFTERVFRQVLLEVYLRQQSLRFAYPIPLQVSLDAALTISERFLAQKSGGDRALALVGALFDVIGESFGLYAIVKRARINASDEASGQAADLECLDADGKVIVAVEVKDRALKFSDVEGTIVKARHRQIREVIFAAPSIDSGDANQIRSRIATAVAGGQNLYLTDSLSSPESYWRLAERRRGCRS